MRPGLPGRGAGWPIPLACHPSSVFEQHVTSKNSVPTTIQNHSTQVSIFQTLTSAEAYWSRYHDHHDTSTSSNHASGFLPGTTLYVYVRCRTYPVRHRTSDVRCRTQHRTYDIVSTMLHTTLNIRHRTFVNIIGATYDIVGQTNDIVCSMKCMSYTMSYVPENLRHHRLVYSCRIRCRRCI
jgi:hypothetical protein